MDELNPQIASRITRTLFFAQVLGSAGFITSGTVTSIAGANLSGQSAWAGVPSAVYQLGGALSALVWGYAMDRIGRRGGLALGLMLGMLGAAIAGLALVSHAFLSFLGGLTLMGMSNAALQLSRFVAAEVYPPPERGRAISNVVIGGTAGAVFGPLMVGPMGQLALRAGLDELTGPYAASLLLFAVASVVVLGGLRPDPREIGRELAQLYPETSRRSGRARSIPEIFREPPALVAVLAMVFGQMVMVMLMVITSLHMKVHQHSLGDISVVISSHTFGMYSFSILSGRLADQWGRGRVISIGAGTLVAACLLAMLSPDVLPLSIALYLLGLGWNFCFVGGSTLLADQLSPAERARTQGFNDLLVGLASSLGSLGSGVVFAAVGFGVMGLVGAAAALIPLALAFWWQLGQRQVAPAG